MIYRQHLRKRGLFPCLNSPIQAGQGWQGSMHAVMKTLDGVVGVHNRVFRPLGLEKMRLYKLCTVLHCF